jgi:hypothetical protein
MLVNYEIMFGEKPKEYSSPICERDHPELDTTEEMDDIGKKAISILNRSSKIISYLRQF